MMNLNGAANLHKAATCRYPEGDRLMAIQLNQSSASCLLKCTVDSQPMRSQIVSTMCNKLTYEEEEHSQLSLRLLWMRRH